jgi:hypothetical protein
MHLTNRRPSPIALGTGESYVAFETNGTFTFNSASNLSSVAEINEQIEAGVFRARGDDTALKAMDNGDGTFTVAGIPKALYYDTWAGEHGHSGPVADRAANPNGDSLANLYEYGLGGNPKNTNMAAVLPVMHIRSGSDSSNRMEYVYRRRTDYVARGLTYYLETNTNLVDGVWYGQTAVIRPKPGLNPLIPTLIRSPTGLSKTKSMDSSGCGSTCNRSPRPSTIRACLFQKQKAPLVSGAFRVLDFNRNYSAARAALKIWLGRMALKASPSSGR